MFISTYLVLKDWIQIPYPRKTSALIILFLTILIDFSLQWLGITVVIKFFNQ